MGQKTKRRLLLNEQSRGLESRCKSRAHDSYREHCLSRRRLGTSSRKGHYAPNVRVNGFGATRSLLGPLPGSCTDKRSVGSFFL